MTTDSLVAFGGIVLLLAIIPGPNAFLILYTSLAEGRRLALLNVLGISFGFIIHAFVSAQGLSLLLAQSSVAFNILKWVGVGYLLWFGVCNIINGLKQSQRKGKPNGLGHNSSLMNSFFQRVTY